MQPLYKIVMPFAENDIEMSIHLIFTTENLLANMLSRNQFIKIANNYPYL